MDKSLLQRQSFRVADLRNNEMKGWFGVRRLCGPLRTRYVPAPECLPVCRRKFDGLDKERTARRGARAAFNWMLKFRCSSRIKKHAATEVIRLDDCILVTREFTKLAAW